MPDDDKCPACGEWKPDAAREYGGRYADGTELDYCECGYADDEETDLAEVVAWDLGVNLPADHPFAAAA